PGESYVIFEYLQGSDVAHNQLASYIFLAVLTIAATVLLTVITTLRKFWYFAGMGLFIAFVLSLRLDVPLVFGLKGMTVPIIVLTLFLAVSYYFNSFRPSSSFGTRLIVFLTLWAAFAVIIGTFAQVPFPLLHLVVTAYL